MNREAFYLEIGNIDDDLIQEAGEAHRGNTRRINWLRLAGMAACLCAVCFAVIFGLQREVIYYNQALAPIAEKVLVPSDENTTVLMLTYQELFDYYGMELLPDVLSGMRRTEQTNYFVYQSSENTIYDTNILNYYSDDGKQSLSVMIAKNGSDSAIYEEDIRRSRIDGTSVMLAVSESDEPPVYWAEICGRTVSVRVISSGMDEAAFTESVRELIRYLK